MYGHFDRYLFFTNYCVHCFRNFAFYVFENNFLTCVAGGGRVGASAAAGQHERAAAPRAGAQVPAPRTGNMIIPTNTYSAPHVKLEIFISFEHLDQCFFKLWDPEGS